MARNESEMWYLVSECKNMGSAKISDFGRNFCHFPSRRSIFPKNLGKFRKIVKNPFFQKCDKFIFWQLFLQKCVPKSVFYSKVTISTKEKWLIFEINLFPQISCSPHHWPNLFCSFFVEICFFHVPAVCTYPFLVWKWRQTYKDAPRSIWGQLDVSGGS